MKIDAKDLIQKAWVVEVGLLILYGLVIVTCLDPDRVELFIRMLPTYGSLIAGQGLIAAGGPRIKAMQENQLEKIKNGGIDA